ncbi:DUF3304 domain-containing protein [Aromatoleum toluolicum]|uniref:DUF3304 domain-containing protein n=1 Tax=Aromatoleum toluolicum TaxID=90060 RepID=A0ABX1NEL6_9RHOO|nr:DUF3304 domain-containing protein [Aromatoleum toluolicum]NMF97751.1 DUF3304 domain-containing protein [Aromatoleum toluolicum]
MAFIVTLSGCNNGSRESRDDRFSMSSLSAYNFSTEGIQEYYVDGAWGSGVGIGSGGGSVCCVQIPSKWYEGLQVNLEWRRSDCGKGVDENGRSFCRNEPGNPTVNLKRTIPVEPYSEPGTIQIMFLPNDEIRIYVSEDAPWGPDHPSHLGSPRPLTPDEAQGLLAK